MKKLLVTLTAAAMTLCLTVPAFAATADKAEKKEIRQEISAIKKEYKSDKEEFKVLKKENKILSAEFKTMKAAQKSGTDTGIDKEEWEEIKERAKEVKTLRASLKETKGQAKALRKEATAEIKGKNLEAGLDKLQKADDLYDERMKTVNKINELLKQITAAA